MHINATRRQFLAGMAGTALAGATGTFAIGAGKRAGGKIRLAAVGVWGKGFSDWMPMVKSGMAEIVALCDCDRSMLDFVAKDKGFKALGIDLSKIPFYTDYRRLLDDVKKLDIQAMTISTPDHVHAPVAVAAMKQGVHVFVQKPLVRTLWENAYFEKTARENGVVVQMGNQGSALDSMRRCTEVLQSGIIGEVREVHVWTNRPVWPQGKVLSDYIKSRGAVGDAVPDGLDWNAFVATAAARPYLGKFPDDLGPFHNDWKIAPNVYHRFNWRGAIDFGCGAFGDMACHTMNLAFRGLELGAVTGAECTMIESPSDLVFPVKSIVKLDYAARKSTARPGTVLPPVTLYWYDGDEKPPASIMPKYAAVNGGKVPNTGCYIIGTKGAVLMRDDYGAKCDIALDGDTFTDVFKHEAANAVEQTIPKLGDAARQNQKSSVAMAGFAGGHYTEFLRAIRGEGPVYSQTHSRCFSDIEYCIPQMEGILVGVVAQRLPGKKLAWNSAAQTFDSPDANALVKPYIRKGFEF